MALGPYLQDGCLLSWGTVLKVPSSLDSMNSSSYLIRVYWDTNTRENHTLIYFTGSASAEFIADIALCPFEAVKIRVQTQSGFTKGFLEVLAEILAVEGFNG